MKIEQKVQNKNNNVNFAKFIMGSSNASELSVYESGWEKCNPSFQFGPCVRDYYILHYVVDGAGTLWVNGSEYPVTKNQFFLIPPLLSTAYCSDAENPWQYYWLGFGGVEIEKILKLCNFSTDNYVLTYSDSASIIELMNKITVLPEKNISYEYMMLGYCYQLLGMLMKSQIDKLPTNNNEMYIKKAVKFFQKNFKQNIKVYQAADEIGLERSYFTRIFIKIMKQTPQTYLTNLRLNNALLLLRETQMLLKDIATDCGFNDFPHFYRTFCKKLDYTPNDYRENFQFGNFKSTSVSSNQITPP